MNLRGGGCKRLDYVGEIQRCVEGRRSLVCPKNEALWGCPLTGAQGLEAARMDVEEAAGEAFGKP